MPNSHDLKQSADTSVATTTAEINAPAAERAEPAVAQSNAEPAVAGLEGMTNETASANGESGQAAQGLLQSTPEPAPEEPAEDKPEGTGAPEHYEIKPIEALKDVKPGDMPIYDKFLETAKLCDLPQDKVQQLYDAVAPMMAGQPAEAVKRVRAQGIEATKADKEIGGANFDASIKLAMKGFNDARFVTPELRTLFIQTGLDSHPEVVRLCKRLGQLTGEGQFFRDRGAHPAPNDYRRRYPNTKMNP